MAAAAGVTIYDVLKKLTFEKLQQLDVDWFPSYKNGVLNQTEVNKWFNPCMGENFIKAVGYLEMDEKTIYRLIFNFPHGYRCDPQCYIRDCTGDKCVDISACCRVCYNRGKADCDRQWPDDEDDPDYPEYVKKLAEKKYGVSLDNDSKLLPIMHYVVSCEKVD